MILGIVVVVFRGRRGDVGGFSEEKVEVGSVLGEDCG